jgi:uncharacterized protein involved in exopolysaccharide biosynthesis
MREDKGLSLRDALNIIYRRINILRLTVVLLPLSVLAVCLLINPIYESTAQVVVRAKNETSTLLQTPREQGAQMSVSLNVDETDLNSEIEILRSPDLWVLVVNKIGVAALKPEEESWLSRLTTALDNLTSTGKTPQSGSTAEAPPEVRELARQLSKNCKVVMAPKSKVLDLSFKYPDPVMVRKILATLLELYIPYHSEVYALPGAEQFFFGQSDLYKEKYAQAEQEVIEFKKKWGISLAERQKQELITQVKQIEDSLVEVNANLSQYQSILASLRKGLFSSGQLTPTSQRGSENTFLNVVATQLLRAEQRQWQVKQAFLTNTRDYQDAEQMVKDLSTRFAEAVQGETDLIQAKKESLNQSLTEKRAQLELLEEKSEEARRLQIAATVAKDRYLQYAAKEEEARIDSLKGVQKLQTVAVVGKPFTRPDPVFPKTGLFVVGAFFMSIPLGLGLILFASIFDHRLYTPREVEAATGLPVLASFGRIGKGRGKGSIGRQ